MATRKAMSMPKAIRSQEFQGKETEKPARGKKRQSEPPKEDANEHQKHS